MALLKSVFAWTLMITLLIGGYYAINYFPEKRREEKEAAAYEANPSVKRPCYCVGKLEVFDKVEKIVNSGNFKLLADLHGEGELTRLISGHKVKFVEAYGSFVKVRVARQRMFLDECWIEARMLDRQFGESAKRPWINYVPRKIVEPGPLSKVFSEEAFWHSSPYEQGKAIAAVAPIFLTLDEPERIRIVESVRGRDFSARAN